MKRKQKNIIFSILLAVVFLAGLIAYQKWAIAKEIDFQKAVYTKSEIPPRTLITEDMVAEYEVSGKSIPPNAALQLDEVVGKYTADGFGIVSNSIVLKDKLVLKEDLPDAGILDLNKNEEAFPLLVDLETSLGNSIMPKTHVDLYFRSSVKVAEGDQVTEKPVFGKIASHVRVTAAKDTQATNVFNEQGSNPNNNDAQKRALTKLYIFAVSPDQNKLLNKGKLLGEIIPVATGMAYEDKAKATEMEEEELIKWIEEHTYRPLEDSMENAQNIESIGSEEKE